MRYPATRSKRWRVEISATGIASLCELGVLGGAHDLATLGATPHTHLLPSVAGLPTLFGLVSLLSGLTVPLPLFPDAAQAVLRWLPFAGLDDLPYRILLRPRSTVLQLLGQELTLRRVGRLVQGLAVLGYAATAGTIDWTVGRVGLLLASIASGMCAFLGIVVLQATSAFWMVESLEVWSAFTSGGVMMSQYPLDIYRSWFRGVFTYAIPLACVNYFPGVAILGSADPLGTPPFVGWIAPLAGPVFLTVCLQVWRIGVRHY